VISLHCLPQYANVNTESKFNTLFVSLGLRGLCLVCNFGFQYSVASHVEEAFPMLQLIRIIVATLRVIHLPYNYLILSIKIGLVNIFPEGSGCIVTSILEVLPAIIFILFTMRIKYCLVGVVSIGTVFMPRFVKIIRILFQELLGRTDQWSGGYMNIVIYKHIFS
jgi:hypothetical protein